MVIDGYDAKPTTVDAREIAALLQIAVGVELEVLTVSGSIVRSTEHFLMAC